MNKFLRYSFIAILAFICGGALFAAEPYKVLTFPDDNSGENKSGNYTSTWTAKKGDDSWSLTNFNNNEWKNTWTYVKCGRKNNASVASISTAFAIDQAISSVVVTIDKMTAAKVNAISLVVSSDADASTVLETVNASSIAAGDMVFNVATPKANCYYKLVFDCASGTANGLVQVSKVAYYKVGDTPVIVDITNTPEKAYTVAKAHELIAAGEGLASKVYVKGKISSIDNVELEQYYNATYSISDDGTANKELVVFRGYYLGNTKFSSADQIKVGDEVIVYGVLKNYGGTDEFDSSNYIYSLNGVTSGVNAITAEAAAKDAPLYNLAGQKVSKAYKGVVIQNGKKFVNK